MSSAPQSGTYTRAALGVGGDGALPRLGLCLPSYLANCKSNVPNKGFSLVGKPVVFVGQSARVFLYFDALYRRRQHAQLHSLSAPLSDMIAAAVIELACGFCFAESLALT